MHEDGDGVDAEFGGAREGARAREMPPRWMSMLTVQVGSGGSRGGGGSRRQGGHEVVISWGRCGCAQEEEEIKDRVQVRIIYRGFDIGYWVMSIGLVGFR